MIAFVLVLILSLVALFTVFPPKHGESVVWLFVRLFVSVVFSTFAAVVIHFVWSILNA